jgi:hypothetical protein
MTRGRKNTKQTFGTVNTPCGGTADLGLGPGGALLILFVAQPAEKGGEDFDTVPEILEPEIFV